MLIIEEAREQNGKGIGKNDGFFTGAIVNDSKSRRAKTIWNLRP
jgi:hypothetical protein